MDIFVRHRMFLFFFLQIKLHCLELSFEFPLLNYVASTMQRIVMLCGHAFEGLDL